MYYHTDMRWRVILAVFLLPAWLAGTAWADDGLLRPYLTLTESVDQDWGIEPLADWRQQRLIEGMGWNLGTVSRGDGPTMKTGYTVIHPAKDDAFSLTHYYVLDAFDLLPRGLLLITVRDPDIYWPDYDYRTGLVNPVEVVWYTDDWEEEVTLVLDLDEHDYPDGFLLAPDECSLLTILHPAGLEDDPDPRGHRLVQVFFHTGAIREIPLPGLERGELPAEEWWPVLMQWDKDNRLLVQTGGTCKLYEVGWQ